MEKPYFELLYTMKKRVPDRYVGNKWLQDNWWPNVAKYEDGSHSRT